MSRVFPLLLACAMTTVACGDRSPTGPSDAARAARLSRTRFMAFGDSITVGDAAGVTYPAFLQTQLRARYSSQASNIAVTNAGRGGERLLDGVLRFEDAFAVHRPDVVLLMEGVNDLLSLGPDTSTELLQFMAQYAMSRNVMVLLGSMLPSPPGRPLSQPARQLQLLNGRLEAMARQQGLVYVDLYNPLLPAVETMIGPDGLHPTEVGYRRIADLFFNAIRNQFEGR
jgi:lysophospholipase L1-like esterase